MENLIILLSMIIPSTNNPVNLSILLIAISTTISICLWSKSSNSWIPLIIVLLFTGGILVIFMILSSFHPNEGSSNITNFYIITLTIATIAWTTIEPSSCSQNIETQNQFNIFFQTLESITIATLLIILYFNTFTKFLTNEQNSIRITI